MNRPTRIKGLSDARRLPRLGKVRLGIKKVSAKGKEYPTEVEHFVVTPEVAAIYGEQPMELDIMFPVNDPEVFFPQSYKLYGGNQKLKCQGDGETAMQWTEDGTVERECPCELLDAKGGCSQRGNLMVLLPKVSLGGVYQLDTGSIQNIIRINSYIDYLEALVGRIAMIPLKIRRVPEKLEHEGKMNTHYLLQLEFVGDVDVINTLRQDTNRIIATTEKLAIEPPTIEGPEFDTPIVEVEEKAILPWQLEPQTRKEKLLAINAIFTELGEPERVHLEMKDVYGVEKSSGLTDEQVDNWLLVAKDYAKKFEEE